MTAPRFTLNVESTHPYGTAYQYPGLDWNETLTLLPESERVRADTAMEEMEQPRQSFEWQVHDIEYVITREA